MRDKGSRHAQPGMGSSTARKLLPCRWRRYCLRRGNLPGRSGQQGLYDRTQTLPARLADYAGTGNEQSENETSSNTMPLDSSARMVEGVHLVNGWDNLTKRGTICHRRFLLAINIPQYRDIQGLSELDETDTSNSQTFKGPTPKVFSPVTLPIPIIARPLQLQAWDVAPPSMPKGICRKKDCNSAYPERTTSPVFKFFNFNGSILNSCLETSNYFFIYFY